MSAIPGGCSKVNCSSMSNAERAFNSCCNNRAGPVKRPIDIPAGTGRCAGKTGRDLLNCKARQITRDAIKRQPGGSGKAVPAGFNKETSDSILGSPGEWGKAITDQLENCFGTGIPCGTLLIGGLAAVILIMVIK